MALTYEKFYGGVSNAEQLMYKKSCVYSKSKEGKLKWLVKKYLVEFFLKASGIVALSSMELNSGLTAFADNQSDGRKSHIERYHRYDFDTKEESIEEIIVETNSFTDGETTAGYFPNGKISDIDLPDLYAIIGSNDITVVDNPTATPYCSTVCLQITTNNGGTNYGSGFMIGPHALATAAHNLYSIKEKAYVKSVKVAPARSDNSKPFGSENVSASSMIVSGSYLAGTSSEDWAIITLKNNLGTKTGWLGLHWQSSNYSSSQLVYAYGYPSQINGADARYRMCKSSGYIRSQTSKYLKGDWDLTGGFSGGPLVEYISGAGYVAIGIHKDGSTIDGSSYPTSYTGALRITQSLYTLFLSYRG